jgi:hypothetical protein
MVITSDQRSLYEDWQLRRERLLIDSKVIEQYREMQLQLLDYLLRRYRDAAEVQRPARFPLPTELTLNERAIVVHHHLWPGQISGTKSIFDMNRRVSGIVDRMNRVSPEVKDSPPADDAENKYSRAGGSEHAPQDQSAFDSSTIRHTVWRRWYYRIRSLRLRSQLFSSSRYRKRKYLRRCFQQLAQPRCNNLWLLNQLLEYERPLAGKYVFRAWIERVKTGCDDDITDRLLSVLSHLSEKELDQVRMLLAGPNLQARIQAAEALGRFGTLDDVALLSDLLSLPPEPNDEPDERPVIGMAIQQIAGREPFD